MQALEQPLLQDATDDESDDEAPHDSRRSLASRHSRQSQEGGSRRSIAPGFLSMPTFVGQRSGDVRSYPLQQLAAVLVVAGCASHLKRHECACSRWATGCLALGSQLQHLIVYGCCAAGDRRLSAAARIAAVPADLAEVTARLEEVIARLPAVAADRPGIQPQEGADAAGKLPFAYSFST